MFWGKHLNEVWHLEEPIRTRRMAYKRCRASTFVLWFQRSSGWFFFRGILRRGWERGWLIMETQPTFGWSFATSWLPSPDKVRRWLSFLSAITSDEDGWCYSVRDGVQGAFLKELQEKCSILLSQQTGRSRLDAAADKSSGETKAANRSSPLRPLFKSAIYTPRAVYFHNTINCPRGPRWREMTSSETASDWSLPYLCIHFAAESKSCPSPGRIDRGCGNTVHIFPLVIGSFLSVCRAFSQ